MMSHMMSKQYMCNVANTNKNHAEHREGWQANIDDIQVIAREDVDEKMRIQSDR
jgi:hypothetical protein